MIPQGETSSTSSRRSVMSSLALLVVKPKPTSLSLEACSQIICSYTSPELRQAIKNTGHFLYRGDDQEDYIGGPRRRIDHPAPDLLLETTYNDPDALQYFQCLENELKSFARPSTGHVATTAPETAAAWGPVVSVWPLGDRLSYVWPRKRGLLFPGGQCGDVNELVVDQDLANALQKDREVMFASEFTTGKNLPSTISLSWKSAYIVIPREEDERLLALLRSLNFGLN
jgi:hypothetical protein